MIDLKKIEKFFLDILFPVSCVSCQKEGVWLCEGCFSKIEIISAQVCPFCEKNISPEGKICHACKNRFFEKNILPPLDILTVSTSYKKSGVSRMIHLFKYNFAADLHITLGRILLRGLMENNIPLPDIIIPVPLHKRRLRWRGFNQAEKLADFISETLAPGFFIPVEREIVSRKIFTPPQMKIRNYQERKSNMAGAFSLREKSAEFLENKNILLIDDVATTGATLFEIGRLLKENGARKVWGAVIARQEMG